MIFDRVICGVDGSQEGLEAARQGARLVAPHGRLLLIAVADIDVAVHAGWAATQVLAELRTQAEQALVTAEREIAKLRPAESLGLEGPVTTTLLEEARREEATLLCVGTHGRRRATGILLGSTATTLVHEAKCAVLIARSAHSTGPFPSSVVVGIDGSRESAAAAAVAGELRERFGASAQLCLAMRDKTVELERIQRLYADVRPVEATPVDALVSASAAADLVIVGSKGLHGVKALGSVSERVAHRARCSVLVLRHS